MEFYHYKKDELQDILNSCKYNELKSFTKFIYDVVLTDLSSTKIKSMKKNAMVHLLTEVLQKKENLVAIATKIYSSELAKFLYNSIVWNNKLVDTLHVEANYNCKFMEPYTKNSFRVIETPQKGRFSLIIRATRGPTYSQDKLDILTTTESLRVLLKVILPLPDDFHIISVEEPYKTECNYSNEVAVFRFIEVIKDMLKNNLVEIGKTGEKPKVKTLKMLKTTTNLNEFYQQKKLDNFATDMLTRSFYYYYLKNNKFKRSPLESLKDFVRSEFNGKLYFFISRVLLSHLNRVRFERYLIHEHYLFEIMESIISQLPMNDWVSVENIIKFLRYRSLEFHLESPQATSRYWFKDKNGKELNCIGEDYYTCFFNPIIKGAFFYLASLGLFEIKYDDLGAFYISAWDGLKYIKLTPLGQYIFELSDSYEDPKLSEKIQKAPVKFDEFKPIISLQKDDVITKAKLEPFCEDLGNGKMVLSYAKIFKECDVQKALKLKIEAFYKNIKKNPPKVFKEFFNEILQNSNQTEIDFSKVVINLKNNKKLLNLFMTHKRLQEFIIKAQGYRIIVAKKDLNKLSKIVKDNGFFVEF